MCKLRGSERVGLKMSHLVAGTGSPRDWRQTEIDSWRKRSSVSLLEYLLVVKVVRTEENRDLSFVSRNWPYSATQVLNHWNTYFLFWPQASGLTGRGRCMSREYIYYGCDLPSWVKPVDHHSPALLTIRCQSSTWSPFLSDLPESPWRSPQKAKSLQSSMGDSSIIVRQ